MGSLTSCVKKAGAALSAEDKNAILEAARVNRKAGMSTAEAAKAAVRARLEAVQSELAAEQAQVSTVDTKDQPKTLKERAAAMAAKGEPVHQDPGEAPEVATKAVVTEAIKTAADNRDRKPSEMKRELLRMIDEAIPRATHETRDLVPRGKDARTDSRHYIRFKVPGDGTFTIMNATDALREFRDAVDKSPGFRDRASPAPTQPRTKNSEFFGVEKGSTGAEMAVKNMIDEGDPQAAVDYAAARGLVIADVLKGDKVRLPKVAGLTPTTDEGPVGEFEPEVAEAAPALSPAPAAQPVAEPPAQAPAAPMAWHTPLPEQGERISSKDRTTPSNPQSVIDAGRVAARLATEAVDAITQTQRTAGLKLVPWVLPSTSDRNGVVRLLPEDQVPSSAWQRMGTEPIPVGMLTRDQAIGRVRERIRQAPVIASDDAQAPAEAAESAAPAPAPSLRERAEGMRARAAAPAEVQNFGEALPPARRAMAAKLDESLSDDDIANRPLSEIWPLAENEAIEDTFAAAVAHAARAEVPAKPRVAYKLKQWVQKVKTVRELAGRIVSGRATKEQMAGIIVGPRATMPTLRDWWSKVTLLEQVPRDQWKRIGEVEERPDAAVFRDGKPVPRPMVRVRIDDKAHWIEGGGTVADALPKVRELLSGAAPEQRMEFAIYERRSSGTIFVTKKGDPEKRSLMEFATVEEARAAVNEYDGLAAAWEAVKARDNITERDLRSAENRPRTGKDHRGGKDVTVEQFQETFGFRGGEFGKWVQQGKGDKERQALLNQSYDALMDLADIIGVPPRAMSLNGTLGLALGSRGSGWASAHFEPSNLVINLTKTRGAGTLAHEWFHALDNYFSRMRRGGAEAPFTGNQNKYRDENYITHRPESLLIRKDRARGFAPLTQGQLEARRERLKAGTRTGWPPADAYDADKWERDPSTPDGVRPEVEQRFAALVQALKDSPMTKRAALLDKSGGYWTRTLELAARSFENYVIAKMHEQGYHNDFLVNVKKPDEVAKSDARYPYLLAGEVKPIADAFDALFSEVKTRDSGDGNVALFSRTGNFTPGGFVSPRLLSAEVSKIAANWDQDLADVKVVNRVEDLPGDIAKAVRNVGAENTVRGLAMPDARVYLVAENIGSVDEGRFVLFHEVYGHVGMRAFLGDNYSMHMALLRKANPALAKEADAWFERYGEDEIAARVAAGFPPLKARQMVNALAVEEALADRAGNLPELKGWQRIVAALQRGLRRMGMGSVADMLEGMTEAETLDLLVQARKTVQAGQRMRAGEMAGAMSRRFSSLRGMRPTASYVDATPRQQATLDAIDEGPDSTKYDLIPAKEDIGRAADAAFTDWEQERGIKYVPISMLGPLTGYNNAQDTARIRRLADSIKESNTFEPIFVGIDPNGEAYIMEGQHRARALELLGDTHVPAQVIVDMTGTEADYDAQPDAPRVMPTDYKAAQGQGALFSRRTDQTQTPEFKRWFGESKVVDHRGQPRVMFHGTSKSEGGDAFSMFDTFGSEYGLFGQGSYFTASPSVASEYTGKGRGGAPSVYPVFLSIKKPIVMEDRADRGKWEKAFPDVDFDTASGPTNEAFYRAVEEDLSDQQLPKWEGAEVMQEGLRSMGFDGIAHIGGGRRRDAKVRHHVYIAFDPEQVKSATGNSGAFDPTNADIRFSRRTSQDILNAGGGVQDFSRYGKTKQDRLRGILDKGREFYLGALTRDQIADVYGQDVPQVRDYDKLVRSMENERSSLAQRADDLYQRWAKMDAGTNDKLGRIMLDATTEQVHPDSDKAPRGKAEVHAKLRQEFNALPAEAQAMYREVRDFHAGVLEDIKASLIGRIKRQVAAGAERAALLSKVQQQFDQYLENGPYFPLSRFGDYLVIATRPDGERVVAAYENAGEQQAAARELRKDGFTTKLKTAKDYARSQDGSAGKFIGDVIQAVEKVDMTEATINGSRSDLKNQLLDDLNQLFIRSLPDLSYRKHFAHRKNTPGFSADVMRGFASSAFHAASYIARLNHADRMTMGLQSAYEAIDEATEGDFNTQSQVLNELTKRHEAMLNPNTHPLSALATQAGFVMYLGLSPAAGLINMLQVPMVTIPYLGARYGFGKASAAMGKAYADIMKAPANRQSGFNAAQSLALSSEERQAISTLQDEGVIDLTQAHDLAAATDRDVGDLARNKTAFAAARAMRIVGWTFHVPEVMNRQTTALMAYRLERENGSSHEAALEGAREAIKRTQFDYSTSNRARYMQGNIARVVLQFRQFSQNMTYFLGRAAYQALKGESPEVRKIARRQILSTFVVTGAMAGSLGLPGIGAAMGMVGMLVSAMDDEDEPWDWQAEYRNMLADQFGKEWGEVFAKGVPRMLLPGWDIAGRVSLNELWWRSNDREGQNPRESFATDMANILGPTAGTLLGWYVAADHMQRGAYDKAAEAVVPKFIRDPLKAYREAEGGVTSYNGDPLMDVDAWEVLGRSMGFAPSRVSEMYEGRNAVMNAKTAIEERRQRIINQVVKARLDGDPEAEADARSEIAGFNSRNPDFRITNMNIARSLMNRRRNRENTEQGILLPDTKADLRERARFANVE